MHNTAIKASKAFEEVSAHITYLQTVGENILFQK